MEKEILDIDEINLALGFPPEIKETAKTVPPPDSGLTEKETSSSIGLPPTTQILPQPAT